MKNYTLGKWEVRGNRIFLAGTYKSIATIEVQKNFEDITFKPIDDIEALANGKLIADAPNLLALLEQIANSPEPFNANERQSWIDTARQLATIACLPHR